MNAFLLITVLLLLYFWKKNHLLQKANKKSNNEIQEYKRSIAALEQKNQLNNEIDKKNFKSYMELKDLYYDLHKRHYEYVDEYKMNNNLKISICKN